MAPNKKYIVRLDEAERQSLQRMVRSGRHAASKLTRARVLLLADQAEGGPASTAIDVTPCGVLQGGLLQRVGRTKVLEGRRRFCFPWHLNLPSSFRARPSTPTQ